MWRKIALTVSLLLAINTLSYAQAEIDIKNTSQENGNSITYTLTEDLLKINATEIDLVTLEVSSLEGQGQDLPQLLMPTSHANIYAIVDFSNCSDGTYIISGTKGEQKVTYTIILKKN